MANYKTFVVTTDIKVDRSVWRGAGFGDQPSKSEVFAVFDSYTRENYLPGPYTKVTYSGAPGSYRVVQTIRGTQPWWRRLGFGNSAAKSEVYHEWVTNFSGYSTEIRVDVQLG